LPAGNLPAAAAVQPIRLQRDRVTVAIYAHFVGWAWLIYGFSPAVPLLASELGITKAQAGLHGTAMALGTFSTAFLSAGLASRIGRRRTMLLGSLVISLGVATLVTGDTLALTLPGAFVTALGGSLWISAGQPALSVHHHEASAAAVSEANGVGALFGLLSPLAVGTAVAIGWGWRPAVAVTILLAVVAAVLLARLPNRGALGRPDPAAAPAVADAAPRVADADVAVSSPEPFAAAAAAAGPSPEPSAAAVAAAAAARRASRRFPRLLWLFWLGLVAIVAIENATTFWAADLIVTRTGAGPGAATGAVAGLIAGMCVARFVAGPLSLRRAPEKLLLATFAIAMVGWLILWTTTTPAVALIGLVVMGLGYGAQYPLAISLVMRASGGRPDGAQALATMGTGAAIAVAPFLLGAIADQVGSHTAFLLVPLLIVCGAAAVLAGVRLVHRSR
jgi:fucose permease